MMVRWTTRPPYPAGLRLAGRRVVVVGGGHVAQRRVPTLIAAGADVVVVSPAGHPGDRGTGRRRRGDVGATRVRRGRPRRRLVRRSPPPTTPPSTRRSRRRAEERRIFCVRADDATRATAWTPAVGRHAGVTVAVLGQPRAASLGGRARRDPRGAARGHDQPARHRERSPGVVLVGGGPGDPELITVAGRRALHGGRRRGRRPARPARAARRAAQRRRAGRRRQAAARPFGAAGGDQPDHRRAGAGRASASCASRAATASSSAAASRRSSRAARPASPVHRHPGAHQPDLRAGHRRHPGDPPRGGPRVHGDLRSPAARPRRLARRLGRRWPGCAAPWCC